MRGDPLLLKLLLDVGFLEMGFSKTRRKRVDFDGQVQWRQNRTLGWIREFSPKMHIHLRGGGSNISMVLPHIWGNDPNWLRACF